MSDNPVINRAVCMQACEAGFIRCTNKKPTGCVEALRICREGCPGNDDKP